MHHVTCYLVSLAIVLNLAFPLASYAQAGDKKMIVRAVVFNGFDNVSQDVRTQTQKLIKTQVGQPFDDATAKDDTDAIQELGWFLRADYRTEPVDNDVRVIFTVVEYPKVEQIIFQKNKALDSDALQKLIQTRPGDVLNMERVKQDAEKIKEAYARQGFTQTTFEDIKIVKNDLVFIIFEPVISAITIEGDKDTLKTKEYIIRRELAFKVGDTYNVKDIQRSLRNLEHLGIFKEVQAFPELGTEPGSLMVTLHVVEQRTGLAALGVGHSNIKGLIGFVDVADTNLFGTGQRVSARVQFGADNSYQLSYSNPWVGKKRTGITTNLYDRTVLRQAVQADETTIYNEKRAGGNISLSRPVYVDEHGNSDTTAFLTFRVDRISASKEGEHEVPAELLERSDVRSIGLSGVRDQRVNSLRNPLNPYSGTYLAVSSEVAGLLGGSSFNKFSGEARRYFTVRTVMPRSSEKDDEAKGERDPQRWVFATRLSGGIITGTPPFLDQFLLGGAESLRGFKEDRFPGKNMLMWNNELRIPINDSLQTVAFLDTGDAWGGSFASGFGDAKFSLHTGYGVGLRVTTPIGPLRLDYGLNTEGGKEFHFGVGSTF